MGAVLGVIGGVIWGAIAFRPGAPAMWAVAIATAIFLGVVGAFVGGMSGLESPDQTRTWNRPSSTSPRTNRTA